MPGQPPPDRNRLGELRDGLGRLPVRSRRRLRQGRLEIASAKNRRYSLHSQLLPYVEQAALFNAINFFSQPFAPDQTGDPSVVTGGGPNETAARTSIDVFLCPSDFDRMPSRPWGHANYRSCNGSSWSGRAGDGMFGQSTRIRTGDVRDGLSNTAAVSERIRGHDDYTAVDSDADLFRNAAPWTEETFRAWCRPHRRGGRVAAEEPGRGELGHELARGEHDLDAVQSPPAARLQVLHNGLTWDGVAMTANGRHGRSSASCSATAPSGPWPTRSTPASGGTGTIAGGEPVAGDSF